MVEVIDVTRSVSTRLSHPYVATTMCKAELLQLCGVCKDLPQKCLSSCMILQEQEIAHVKV